MFEKTQKAVNDLSAALTEDATSALAVAKATVIPAVSGLLNKIANAANTVAQGVEDGSLFKAEPDANELAKAHDGGGFPDPLPTETENNAIKILRALGKTDEEIAQAVGVSLLTVKMST
jgi:hypothetical protein